MPRPTKGTVPAVDKTTFMDHWRAGDDVDVDDFVEAWHAGAGEGLGLGLDAFLGMTPQEGDLFARSDELPLR